MSFKCGIVGLPNVGKSTLFNALTNSNKAQAENFPFCTIDPNIGVVPVPDQRIDKLTEISSSKKKINTTISFVDIAGLVKGASKGEGLGNKFLSHIREVDAIIHVVRCFDSADIQNVNSSIDPIRDLEIIETEMMLADLDSVQKRLDKKNKKTLIPEHLKILETALDCLNNNKDLSILYKDNLSEILNLKKNVAIDNLFLKIKEEDIFHIINHCNNEDLKIFITSNLNINEYNFKLADLKSRLKTFYHVSILNPDDEMVKIILTKLLHEKQFIIRNPEIFDFLVKRIERSYQSIYNIVKTLDKLSLQKKRQLTIPLIKEIL